MGIHGLMFDYTTIIVLVKALSGWQRHQCFTMGVFRMEPDPLKVYIRTVP